MTATRRIAIRAGHIIAHDGRGHRHLRDGVVVIEGDQILHVGTRFDGAVDETVDATDRVVTPGLISTHAHIGGSPLDRSFLEDCGNPQFWYSGLFEMLPVRHEAQDEEAGRACVDFSMAELLRGGVTTVMEIGGLGEYVVERAAHYGLRVYMGLTFRSGRWLTRDGRRVIWEWDEAAGRRALERATEFYGKYDGAHGDLVRCFFAPAQIDTCTPELLQEAKRRADEARRPYQVHTSQSVVEFNEMLARHGKTPVAWLHELGVLGPSTILGHAIIIGGSSWTNYPAGDLALMGDAGLLRRPRGLGVRAARRRHGVVRALQEGRRQHVPRDGYQPAERDRGHALGGGGLEDDGAQHGGDDGCRRLRRGDAGRRAGARTRRPRPDRAGRQGRPRPVEAASWRMTPLRDPIKNIVYNAADEDIDRVYVNGRVVVDGGRVVGADEPAILKALQAGGERMWPRMAKHDWAGRGADQLSPPTYPAWE